MCGEKRWEKHYHFPSTPGASPHFPKLSAYYRKAAQPDASHLGTVSPDLPSRPGSVCSFVTHSRPSLCLVCDETSGTSEKFWSPQTRLGSVLLFKPALLAGGKGEGARGTELRDWDLPRGLGHEAAGSQSPFPDWSTPEREGICLRPHSAARRQKQPRDRRPGPSKRLAHSEPQFFHL